MSAPPLDPSSDERSAAAHRSSLTRSTWTELAEREAPIVAVPVGSCEQHGPHLPLDTDTRIASALVGALADRCAGVLAGPPLTIGASGEHADFPGTLSIGTDALATVVVELVRSADWSAGVVLVNGHGGNREAIARAVTVLHAEGRRVLAWWPTAHADDDAHAGGTETSVMLALDPDLVRAARPVGATQPLGQLAGTLRRSGVRAVSPNGVLGDASGADADRGARRFASWAADLVTTVDAWREEAP